MLERDFVKAMAVVLPISPELHTCQALMNECEERAKEKHSKGSMVYSCAVNVGQDFRAISP